MREREGIVRSQNDQNVRAYWLVIPEGILHSGLWLEWLTILGPSLVRLVTTPNTPRGPRDNSISVTTRLMNKSFTNWVPSQSLLNFDMTQIFNTNTIQWVGKHYLCIILIGLSLPCLLCQMTCSLLFFGGVPHLGFHWYDCEAPFAKTDLRLTQKTLTFVALWLCVRAMFLLLALP